MSLSSSSDAVVIVNRNPINEHLNMDTETQVKLGAVQPKGIDFKVTSLLVSGKVKNLKFQEGWYNGRPWLEYSVEEDAACCYYCRIFQPKVNGNY